MGTKGGKAGDFLVETSAGRLARTLIPGDHWFTIANQMLAHDTVQNEHRDAGRGIVRARLPAEVSTRKSPTLPPVVPIVN